MKLLSTFMSCFAFVSILSACSNSDSSTAAGPTIPVENPNGPISTSNPKTGNFSVRENRSRDLGKYISGQNDSAIFCSLVDVPNSAYGKLINLDAQWLWQNQDTSEKEYFHIRIEAQSPRNIMPGKNKFDFVDAHVRLYKSKHRPISSSGFANLPSEDYGCDVSNLEKKDQKLSGRIHCFKNNVYHAYNIRLNFNCTLN